MNQKRNQVIFNIGVILLLSGFFLYATHAMFSIAYASVYFVLLLRASFIHPRKRMKFAMAVAYTLLFIILILFNNRIVFDPQGNYILFYFSKLFCVSCIIMPFMIEHFFVANQYTIFYFPSVQDLSAFSFHEIKESQHKIVSALEDIKRTGKSLSVENLEIIAKNLPRHNSFRYVNNGTLTEDYFQIAKSSLCDPHIYIILSNTGSAASEIISVYTKKQYNHASLSFDYDLKTIISYNGGERLYPPGMNQESLEFFNQKQESSIIVYAMDVTVAQKSKILDKVREINTQGSAYNLLGLIWKSSYKANIMFCSQFVYKMLQYADIAPFEKKDGAVKPTDLVELDYKRKLDFAYEICLNDKSLAEEEQLNVQEIAATL